MLDLDGDHSALVSEMDSDEAPASRRFVVAVDIGGTFTDFVLQDRVLKKIYTHKVLSTPDAPERAIFGGLQELGSIGELKIDDCEFFLHATTIITNAVIERKGQDFILLHTEGFGTAIETGHEYRYDLTNLKIRFPEPLTKASLKLAVNERVVADGSNVRRPDKQTVIRQLEDLVSSTGVTNFAICFLHSYKNPENEELVQSWIAERFPDSFISISSMVAPARREYERWTTCAVNAYTKPLLASYVNRLQRGLAAKGYQGSSLMMTSSGLPLGFEHCVEYPVRLIESGPAAGVISAQEISSRNSGLTADYSFENVLAYDMGGTTAKGAFLTSGELRVQAGLEVARVGAFQKGSGLPLLIPAVDLIEIGAGGGGIASIDARGVIAVGPQSAGADPGPACYGRGGQAATLTDANLVLGLLNAQNFRNSGIEVYVELARDAIAKTIAAPLGISIGRAAIGIHETINDNVARAFRVHAAELGLDHRKYTLICTGGSSPLHAAKIARILNIKQVIFPFGAGVSSAFGLFASKKGMTLQKTHLLQLDKATPHSLHAIVEGIISAEPYAAEMAAKGAQVEVNLGMCYQGQGYETSVKIGNHAMATYSTSSIKALYEEGYKRIFGITFPNYEIDIVNWTINISYEGSLAQVSGSKYHNLKTGFAKNKEPREIHLDSETETRLVQVYDRYALGVGDRIEGPAIIEENETTIFIPNDATAVVAPSLDIVTSL